MEIYIVPRKQKKRRPSFTKLDNQSIRSKNHSDGDKIEFMNTVVRFFKRSLPRNDYPVSLKTTDTSSGSRTNVLDSSLPVTTILASDSMENASQITNRISNSNGEGSDNDDGQVVFVPFTTEVEMINASLRMEDEGEETIAYIHFRSENHSKSISALRLDSNRRS